MRATADTPAVHQDPALEVRTSEEARPRAWRRVRELVAHREILMNLVR